MYRILEGDVTEQLKTLADESVQCMITSPPYWGLRDYGVKGQLGLEKTPEEYIAKMVAVFREVRRVLRGDGTCWINMGDSYASGKGTCYNPGGGTNSLGQERKAAGAHPLDRGNKSTLAAVGLKSKDLVGIPWMPAFALRTNGWYLRQDIIWAKPNPMPESVTDRCTKSHEYLFLLTKSARYFYDAGAIKEPAVTDDMRRPYTSEGAWQLDGRPVEQRHGGQIRTTGNKTHKLVAEYERSDSEEHRTAAGLLKIAETAYATRNKRSVWTIATQPFKEAHFATFLEKLVEPCILAGSRTGDTVLDCFAGSGTTGAMALRHGRNFIGIELNPEYAAMARRRIETDAPLFNKAANSKQ